MFRFAVHPGNRQNNLAHQPGSVLIIGNIHLHGVHRFIITALTVAALDLRNGISMNTGAFKRKHRELFRSASLDGENISLVGAAARHGRSERTLRLQQNFIFLCRRRGGSLQLISTDGNSTCSGAAPISMKQHNTIVTTREIAAFLLNLIFYSSIQLWTPLFSITQRMHQPMRLRYLDNLIDSLHKILVPIVRFAWITVRS